VRNSAQMPTFACSQSTAVIDRLSDLINEALD
jgi:hypothetical protein